MKATGIIRRIDDLGRIVIPKEIRKTMRIKDGESLEIYLESDNIILKKYSHSENLSEFYKSIVDSIYSENGENIIIVDRDKFLAIAGDFKKIYLNKSISSELDKIIENRFMVISDGIKDLELSSNLFEKVSYAISPIITNGDAVGAVIILSSSRLIDEFENKTVSTVSKFLGKYIE